MKRVSVIEPVKIVQTKKKVCAYCRVSTDHEEQASSLFYQQRAYKELIENNPDWTFAGIYSDSGKSGTTATNRNGFISMIRMCILGEIDLIITKSVTRFARNTLDTIEIIRSLKNIGVSVYFEKERINSLSSEGELLLTLLAMYAQEESYNTSQNIKWSIRKQMMNGSFRQPVLPIGYEYINDDVAIDLKTAPDVRKIFEMYLNGDGTYKIASFLNRTKCLVKKSGKPWYTTDIKRILKNPVYRGKMILQQSFTTDTLPRIRKKNTGELNRYHYLGNHQALISEAEATTVDSIIRKRAEKHAPDYDNSSSLTTLLCDGVYNQKPTRNVRHLKSGQVHIFYRFHDYPFLNGSIGTLSIKQLEIEILGKKMMYKLMYSGLLKDYRSELTKVSDSMSSQAENKKVSNRVKKAGVLNHLVMNTDCPVFSMGLDSAKETVYDNKLIDLIEIITATDSLISEVDMFSVGTELCIADLLKRISRSIIVYQNKVVFSLSNGLYLEEGR